MAQWAVFLFASHLLGHFIFMFGSFLDDIVYDRLRNPRKGKDEDVDLLEKIAKSIDQMNIEVKDALLTEIAKLAREAVVAFKAKQRSIIVDIEKMVKQMRYNLSDAKESAPSAILDKLEKELLDYEKNHARFIRRLIKWALDRSLIKWTRKRLLSLANWAHNYIFSENPDGAVNRAREIKRDHVPDVDGKPVINTFQWSKAHLAMNFPAGLAEVQRFEADSKFFRSLVVVLLILAGWFFWKAFGPNWLAFCSTGSLKSLPRLSDFKNNQNWPLFIPCLFLSSLSFMRYVQQRFKSTQQAYWFVITLEKSLPPTAAKQ